MGHPDSWSCGWASVLEKRLCGGTAVAQRGPRRHQSSSPLRSDRSRCPGCFHPCCSIPPTSPVSPHAPHPWPLLSLMEGPTGNRRIWSFKLLFRMQCLFLAKYILSYIPSDIFYSLGSGRGGEMPPGLECPKKDFSKSGVLNKFRVGLYHRKNLLEGGSVEGVFW